MKPILAFLIATYLWMPAKAQGVEIQLSYGKREFVLNDTSVLHQEKRVTFTQLRFYLSGFTLLLKDSVVWQEENSFHLIDASQPESQQWKANLPDGLDYDALQFAIGVDSATSCSGAMGGDLDPTKGMFWSWNSGYINFKLEGTYPDCPARNHKFEFHLGGYQSPYATMQTLQVLATPNTPILIAMDVSEFIKGIDLTSDFRVMSPGKAAFDLSISSTKMCTNAVSK